MKLRTNLTELPTSSGIILPRPEPQTVYARVVDIILNEDHPDYESNGKVESLNGIRYRPLKSSSTEQDPSNLPFAFSIYSHIKHVPLIDEIVEIREGVSYSLETSEYFSKTYYLPALNIWNNPNHNALPDVNQNKTEAVLGKDVLERDNLSALQPFSGDTYVEGRFGNSIRLSGYKHPKNILSNDTNNGDPFIIIKNSKRPSKSVLESQVEDINTDDTSVYLTSNHTVPLSPISYKRSTFDRTSKVEYDYIPNDESRYKGRQLVAKSDRIVLQAGDDSVLISAKEAVSLVGKSVNLDSESYIAINGKKIFLGDNAKIKSDQPALRGADTADLLKEVLDLLIRISNDFLKITSPPQAVEFLQKLGMTIPTEVEGLKGRLGSIQSTKVFVE